MNTRKDELLTTRRIICRVLTIMRLIRGLLLPRGVKIIIINMLNIVKLPHINWNNVINYALSKPHKNTRAQFLQSVEYNKYARCLTNQANNNNKI